MDAEQCKSLAQKIINMYDQDRDGFVDTFELGYMLSDVYRAMNKGFNPTPTDLASYTRVIDSNEVEVNILFFLIDKKRKRKWPRSYCGY